MLPQPSLHFLYAYLIVAVLTFLLMHFFIEKRFGEWGGVAGQNPLDLVLASMAWPCLWAALVLAGLFAIFHGLYLEAKNRWLKYRIMRAARRCDKVLKGYQFEEAADKVLGEPKGRKDV